MTRAILVVIMTAIVTGCSLLGFDGPNRRFTKVDLDDIEPTVRFVDAKPVTIPESDIEDVSAEQVIASYQRLMQSPHIEVKRQATRRLADLNMRLAEARNMALSDGSTDDQLPPSIRDASYHKAAELYQSVISDFPQQADDASIRYQLSRALALDGKQEESLVELDSLVSQHQTSPEIVEVEFRRGEAYFLRRNYREAAGAYDKVVSQGKESEFYDKALYKLGWAMFKLADYEASLNSFFPLLERLKEDEKLSNEVRLTLTDLVKDTHRAISLAFYNLSGPESIAEYFQRVGTKEYESEIYQKLAEFYLFQERYQDAAKTYLSFVKANPNHEQAPRFQLAVIKTYVDGGFPSLVLPSKESFLTQFGVKSAFWKQTTQAMQDELKAPVKSNLEEVSSHYHALAQSSRQGKDYLVAAQWYGHFLLLFKEEADVAPYHFLMAEALYDAKQYQEAIKEFDIIAYQYKAYSKREQAAYNILLAYQELEKAEQAKVNKKRGATPQQVTALAALKEKSINYTLLYSEFFPSSPRAAGLLLRSIEELIELKRLPEAIQASERLLALTGPKTPSQNDRAKTVIADGWFDLGDYVKAEKAIGVVLAETQIPLSEKQAFRERRAESIYKQADALKAAGENDKAIAEFQRLARVEPNSKVRPNAELDAATLLMKMENWSSAKIALEGFKASFATHALAAGLNEKLAVVYEKLQDWGSAALAYQGIGAETKDPEKAREIQWYVADLHLKANDQNAAIQAYKEYIRKYPQPYLQAMEGRAKLVGLYEQAEDFAKLNVWRGRIVDAYRAAGGRNNDRTKYLAAQSSFHLAEPLYSRFRSIKLTLPLQKSLGNKKRAMDVAIKAYGEIGRYKVAEFTTASTHRVGEIYQILATDIMKSEQPTGMSEDEAEEYSYLIEDQAFPIEEKAIGIFQSNSNRVINNIYDDWVKRSFLALAKLQPARYDKQEVVEPWFGVSQ